MLVTVGFHHNRSIKSITLSRPWTGDVEMIEQFTAVIIFIKCTFKVTIPPCQTNDLEYLNDCGISLSGQFHITPVDPVTEPSANWCQCSLVVN